MGYLKILLCPNVRLSGPDFSCIHTSTSDTVAQEKAAPDCGLLLISSTVASAELTLAICNLNSFYSATRPINLTTSIKVFKIKYP
jgi:hypothetical protein